MNKIFNQDCIEGLKQIKNKSVNFIFADPPYYLSNGGVSYSSGKVVSVNKGEWDKSKSKEETNKFNKLWLKESMRVLKNDGSIMICGTHHNIFNIGITLKELDFKIINFITWEKTTPPPLIYKNKFRFSAEHIIWAKPNNKHKFNYKEMFEYNNKEMTDVFNLSAVTMAEKKYGKHPTMKPVELLELVIKATTSKNDVVLDPFLGSGTTCISAKKLGRNYIGFEKEESYFKIALKRLENTLEKL